MDAVTQDLNAHLGRIDRKTDEESALGNIAWRIARNKAELREVIEGWLVETEIDIPGLLACMYARLIPCRPEWAEQYHKHETDIAAGITEAVDKQARYEIDNLGDLE